MMSSFTLTLSPIPKVETSQGSYISNMLGHRQCRKRPDGTPIPNLVAVDEHTVTFTYEETGGPELFKEHAGL